MTILPAGKERAIQVTRILIEAMNRFEMSDPEYIEAMPIVGRLKQTLQAVDEMSPDDSRWEPLQKILRDNVELAENWLERQSGPVLRLETDPGGEISQEEAGEFALVTGQINGYEYLANGENPQYWTVANERFRLLVEGTFRSYDLKRINWTTDGFCARLPGAREALLGSVFLALRLTLFNIEQNPLQKLFKLRLGIDAGQDFSEQPGGSGSRLETARVVSRRLAERIRFLDEKNIYGRILLSEDGFQAIRLNKEIFRTLDVTKHRFDAEPARGLPAEFAYKVLFL